MKNLSPQPKKPISKPSFVRISMPASCEMDMEKVCPKCCLAQPVFRVCTFCKRANKYQCDELYCFNLNPRPPYFICNSCSPLYDRVYHTPERTTDIPKIKQETIEDVTEICEMEEWIAKSTLEIANSALKRESDDDSIVDGFCKLEIPKDEDDDEKTELEEPKVEPVDFDPNLEISNEGLALLQKLSFEDEDFDKWYSQKMPKELTGSSADESNECNENYGLPKNIIRKDIETEKYIAQNIGASSLTNKDEDEFFLFSEKQNNLTNILKQGENREQGKSLLLSEETAVDKNNDNPIKTMHAQKINVDFQEAGCSNLQMSPKPCSPAFRFMFSNTSDCSKYPQSEETDDCMEIQESEIFDILHRSSDMEKDIALKKIQEKEELWKAAGIRSTPLRYVPRFKSFDWRNYAAFKKDYPSLPPFSDDFDPEKDAKRVADDPDFDLSKYDEKGKKIVLAVKELNNDAIFGPTFIKEWRERDRKREKTFKELKKMFEKTPAKDYPFVHNKLKYKRDDKENK